jgi:polar amino acid transport system substrate-binding protein
MRTLNSCISTIAVLLIFFTGDSAKAESTSRVAGPDLRVVVKKAEPFVLLNKSSQPSGYSVELWEEVARTAGFSYHYSTSNTVDGMIRALADKDADIAVGALSITSERETKIDFSHSIYDSGLGLMVRSENSSAWILNFLEQSKIMYLAGFMLLGFVVAAHVIWLIHRKKNTDYFPSNYFHGISEAIWWSSSVFLGRDADGKKVDGWWARIFMLGWILTGLVFVSYLTATLATAMTVSQINSQIHDLSDLKGREIATVEKSQAADFLAIKGMTSVLCPDLNAAVGELKEGKVRAVFYDVPILRYQLKLHQDTSLLVLPMTYLPHQYGFGLQFKSPYVKQVNEAILTLKENGRLEEIRKKWFGDDAPTN